MKGAALISSAPIALDLIPRTQCYIGVATETPCQRQATRTWRGIRVCDKHYERLYFNYHMRQS